EFLKAVRVDTLVQYLIEAFRDKYLCFGAPVPNFPDRRFLHAVQLARTRRFFVHADWLMIQRHLTELGPKALYALVTRQIHTPGYPGYISPHAGFTVPEIFPVHIINNSAFFDLWHDGLRLDNHAHSLHFRRQFQRCTIHRQQRRFFDNYLNISPIIIARARHRHFFKPYPRHTTARQKTVQYGRLHVLVKIRILIDFVLQCTLQYPGSGARYRISVFVAPRYLCLWWARVDGREKRFDVRPQNIKSSTIGQHFTLIAESLDDTLATPDPL